MCSVDSNSKKGGAKCNLNQLLDIIDDSTEAVVFTVECLLGKAYLKEARYIYHKYRDALKLDKAVKPDYLADLA